MPMYGEAQQIAKPLELTELGQPFASHVPLHGHIAGRQPFAVGNGRLGDTHWRNMHRAECSPRSVGPRNSLNAISTLITILATVFRACSHWPT